MTMRRRINRTMLAAVIGIAALAGSAPGRASVSGVGTPISSVLDTADAALAARGEVQQRAQLSRELLDRLAHPWRDALTKAVALAKAGTAAQARTLALDVGATATAQAHASPAQAAASLASLYGLDADAGQLARLDQISAPGRVALTHLIDAFASMRMAARVAFASADAVAGSDLAGLFATRGRLLDAVVALREAIGRGLSATESCSPIAIPPAFSIDLDTCDNTYAQDIALLVDAGGNDTYFNNAGGGSATTLCDPLIPSLGVAAALIDLSGDDSFGDPANPRFCGANGGGFLGVGFLLDAAGSDTYTALGNGTNGGGATFGVGFLLDAAGSDTYTAGAAANGGGGSGGIGFLLDAAGNDSYTAVARGTNGGSFAGRGFLLDAAGNDTYTGGVAANGEASTGVGLLLDGSGTDSYDDVPWGTCTDCTRAPKGIVGAQVDL